MDARQGYPRCTLTQLFVMIWLAAIFLSLWAVPRNIGRPLFVPAPSPRSICLGNHRPIAAIVEGDAYRILDCQTRQVLHRGRLQHRLASQNSLDWKAWPDLTPYGGGQNPWLPYGFASVYLRFSDDDRFLAIISTAENSKNEAITLMETSTGERLTWIGEPSEPYFDGIRFDPHEARIRDKKGVAVARLKSTEPLPKAKTPTADPDISGLAYWETRWDAERKYLVSLFAYDMSEEGNFGAHYLGPDQSAVLVSDGFLFCQPFVVDTQTGERVDVRDLSRSDAAYFIENVVEDSFLVYGTRDTLFSDRLGVSSEALCWNLKDGRAFSLPVWNCDIEKHADRLLFNDYSDHELFWIDTKDDSRETVFHDWRLGYAREGVIFLWCVAWLVVTRPMGDKDRSRWLGLVLAISVIVALAPPLIPVFSPHAIGPGYRWLFAAVCLSPLAMSLGFSAIQKTASLSLLIFGAMTLALMLTAWTHFGGVLTSQNGSLARQAWNQLPFDDLEHEADFFRPWRFGAPKPDDIVHIEFRDTLQTTELKP